MVGHDRRTEPIRCVCRPFAGLAVAIALCLYAPSAAASDPDPPKLVVVLYPHECDGAPGTTLINGAIRSTFAGQGRGRIEVRNEYVDTTRLHDSDLMRAHVALLQQKYAGRKIDLVIAGLSAGLDFALAVRGEVFPDVPIVHVLVEQNEVAARRLPPGVTGVPVRMDLPGTLDLALKFHPDTRRVFVVAGSSAFDVKREAEARQAFRPYEGRVEFVYLGGLPMADLLGRVADLPEQSVVYYLHVFRDGAGKGFVPADALERLAAVANAPIYSHVDTFVDRGAVGGHVYMHETEGLIAARLGLRILSGEKPEAIPVADLSENTYLFNGRQLQRWGVRDDSLPAGSVVRSRKPTFWDQYRWHVGGVIGLCVVEAVLIAGLLFERWRRRQADARLRVSHQESRRLAGRLLEAQEEERRRLARELHDDVNQALALLAVEMDLLVSSSAGTPAGVTNQLRELSARAKELSSSVHDLSHQLHPSKLEQVGLVAAVRGLCQEVGHNYGLDVKFTHCPDPGRPSADTAICLYRIAQEALRNVVKHSGSRHAAVELCATAAETRLRISDDGVGFDPAATDHGLGLVSMRERLHIVGGELAIDSKAAGGTRIEVRVPAGLNGEGKP
jgi:signal transduction histidine kinase